MVVQENLAAQERLQRINQEIYKRNAELAVKNKTLSLLRQLYEITTLTLETNELAHKLVESIRGALSFKLVGILMVDKDEKLLTSFAASFSDRGQINRFSQEYTKLAIPLSSQANICAEALRMKEKKQTEIFFDVVTPLLSESTASTIQKNSHIQTSLVYPLLTENKKLGVLLFVLNRKAKDLSFFEKESIASLVNVVAVALDKALLYEALTNLTKELEVANRELKRLDAAKSEFLSIASHQLRTPLTAVKGYISLILEGTYGTIAKKLQRPIKNVYDSNERLIRLVNDLLSLSRIESGKMELNIEETDLEKMAQSVLNELKIKAEQKNLELIFKEPAQPFGLVFVDSEKIRNVILNLVDNSIRYTEKGSITISAAQKNNKLLLTVQDTGVGMTKEGITKLFESFTRGQAGVNLSSEGAGLGLYIAKQFVKMHKGKIWAESPGKGQGSTFHIELPITTKQ